MQQSQKRALAMTLCGLAGGLTPFSALAEKREAPRSYSVPAEPMSQATAALATQAGISIIWRAPAGKAAQSNAVAGANSVPEALNKMLAGSGLTWHPGSGDTIFIDGDVAPTGNIADHMLSAVRIEGSELSGSGAFADLNGFGAGAGANGSSDVTATEGTGSFTGNGTTIASKTPLSLKDTPATVNVLTSEQIKQQNLADVTEALNTIPGVTVVNGPNNVPSFIDRGFEIKAFQVDGAAPIRSPSATTPAGTGGLNLAFPDISEYDHVEIVRGSSALFGGASDPSGTVNLARKRPLDHQQLVVDAQYGSWAYKRLEVDETTPVAFDGALRVRGTAAYQDNDFSYDFARSKTLHLFGSVEADLGHDIILRFGGSYQFNLDRSPNLYGAQLFDDGTDAHLSRSTNLTALWAYDYQHSNEQFIQIEKRFNNDWRLKLDATRTGTRTHEFIPEFGESLKTYGTSDLFYDGYDDSLAHDQQYSVEANLNGSFLFRGIKQSFTVGFDFTSFDQGNDDSSRTFIGKRFNLIDPKKAILINQFDFDPLLLGYFPPLPPVDNRIISESNRSQLAGYVQLLLEPFKRLHVSGGVRYSSVTETGKSLGDFNYGVNDPDFTGGPTQKISDWAPSVALSYDIRKSLSAYANYSQTFAPTGIYTTPAHFILPPEQGRTLEAGLKFAPERGKLNASVAFYSTRQNNVPILLEYDPIPSPFGICCYAGGGKIFARGVDLEISGELARNWQISAGYNFTITHYNTAYVDAETGNNFPFAQTQEPKHQIKIWNSYTLPFGVRNLRISGGVRLDSKRFTGGVTCLTDPITSECISPRTPFQYTQPLYVLADARLSVTIIKQIELGLEVKNLLNKRYYTTVNGPGLYNYYGEPRSFRVSLHAKF